MKDLLNTQLCFLGKLKDSTCIDIWDFRYSALFKSICMRPQYGTFFQVGLWEQKAFSSHSCKRIGKILLRSPPACIFCNKFDFFDSRRLDLKTQFKKPLLKVLNAKWVKWFKKVTSQFVTLNIPVIHIYIYYRLSNFLSVCGV